MSKIVQAANAMVVNSHLITNVFKGGGEYFFEYNSKYKWSISEKSDGVWLWFYPGSESVEQLAFIAEHGWEEGIALVSYNDQTIGTKEAKATFKELYLVVQERLYGVTDVLDDIIGEAE